MNLPGFTAQNLFINQPTPIQLHLEVSQEAGSSLRNLGILAPG